MSAPLAVTGMGAVTAAGVGVDPLWDAALSGRSGIVALDPERFRANRVRRAALAPFDPADHLAPPLLRTIDRFAAMALVAAQDAIDQSGLDLRDGAERTAVIVGTGLGGVETSDAGARVFHESGRLGDPLSVPKIMPSAAASQIAMRFGLHGVVLAPSSACASSAQAIGLGLQLVRAGIADRAVVGGSEAMVLPSVLKGWEGLHVLTPDEPRPFSRGRNGMTLGEGAGILVLEPLAEATRRGARVQGLVLGYGSTSDAGDLLRPDAASAARTIGLALADAGVEASDVAYVNAHGTATVVNDAVEAQALRLAFGERLAALPVSSTKPIHGHTIGAASAIETIVTIRALAAGIAPPTIGFLETDPRCPVDCVPNRARAFAGRIGLTNSFAFGGINACLVVGASDPVDAAGRSG